ncbi:MAG: hypothetical protein ACI4XR_00735 [Bacilli bacterium]
MDKIIKNILKKIENEGYEAYIVGGFVRDNILKKQSYDVDICTNAKPKDLLYIFKVKQRSNNYGGVNFKIKKFNIDITTYRKEKKYDKRHPVEIEYINNLFDDIKRRDFTINAICLDKNDKIIDILNGQNDIKEKLIRSIGSANEKFNEDPLRMLRAIRFATILDFNIEKNTFEAIKNNSNLISTLSGIRIKEELTKILSNSNFLRGLNLLHETKIDNVIKLSYKDDIKFTNDILGMWSQLKTCDLEFTKEEKENIAIVKSIINTKQVNNHTLFNYGLYLNLVAGEVLDIDKTLINKMYKALPIKSMRDIDISGKDIMILLNIKPSNKISNIINDIKIKILNCELKNKKSELKKYILRTYKNE